VGGLDKFDQLGRAAVEAGELTEEEFAAMRRELVERNTRAVDEMDG
jgi:hypothetical protein